MNLLGDINDLIGCGCDALPVAVNWIVSFTLLFLYPSYQMFLILRWLLRILGWLPCLEESLSGYRNMNVNVIRNHSDAPNVKQAMVTREGHCNIFSRGDS